MKILALIALTLALCTLSSASRRCKGHHPFALVKDTAHNSAGLAHAIRRYRAILGGEDNGSTPGPVKGGHRSINWDAAAVPGVPDFMPPDFFNTNVPRGLVFKTKRDLFSVSNPGNETDSKIDNRFSSFDPRNPHKFITFSATRLFTPVKANFFIGKFFVPGTRKAAKVTGFGAIFTDVDLHRKTCITYLSHKGCVLATVCAKPKNKGLSFVGVKFHKAKVAKVIVTLGNKAITSKRKGDVVVVDDLIYGEPIAIGRK